MTCPHRIVREARVIPGSQDEARLAMGVAMAVASSTRAPVGICEPGGRLRGWIFRGHPCAVCEPYP